MLLALLSVSGCGVLGLNSPWGKEQRPDYDLIAGNLINSIAQVPHLNPQLATVQVTKSRSSFEGHVNETLDERGYKLEVIASEEGLNQVKAVVKRLDAQSDEQIVYVLSIGQISVERAFNIVADKMVPTGEKVFRGAKERKIVLNNDIFDVVDSAFSTLAFKAYEGPLIEDVLAAEKPKDKVAWWIRDKQNAVKRNIYETMSSN